MPYVSYKGYKTIFFDSALRSSLAVTGLPMLEIEEIIRRVKKETTVIYGGIIDTEKLKEIVIRELKMYGDDYAERYITWEAYRNLRKRNIYKKPIILAIGGASTTGKSLVASELIGRFAITRIIFTDSLRQELRALESREKLPTVYVHTWEAYPYLTEERKKELKEMFGDWPEVVYGYIDQSLHIINRLLNPLLDRLIMEGPNTLIEGVHILPGFVKYEKGENLVEVIIAVDEELHRNMSMIRALRGEIKDIARKLEERKREFELIREIHDFIVEMAKKNGIRVIWLDDFEEAIRTICDDVYLKVKEIVRKYGGDINEA